jgi:hypothetical protein
MIELVKRFAKSMLGFLRSGCATVDQNEGNRRAAICSTCHNNVPAEEARSCGSCGIADPVIASVRALIGKHTIYDNRLKACAICGCDNRIQVWMTNEALQISKDIMNAYPEFCWKKELAR